MEHSNIMACSTTAFEPIFDVAAIDTECTFIWTSLGFASYMVILRFAHAVYIRPNIVAVHLIDFGSSCSTRSTASTYHAFAFGS